MKSRLIVDIVSPDVLKVFPAGKRPADFESGDKNLEQFQLRFVRELHAELLDFARRYFDDGNFEKDFLKDGVHIVGGFEDFGEYEVKTSTKVMNIKGI